MGKVLGSGDYVYEELAEWDQLPAGWTFKEVVDVAVDAQDRVYVFTRGEHPVIVFERDGYVPDGDGLTVREPEEDAGFIVCTNHYRKREQPKPQLDCPRYAKLIRKLEDIAKSHGEKHVTLEVAWQMLESAPIQELSTYHRVVFEPNKKRMHVAFPENGNPRSRGKNITLDVTKLLQRPGE